MSNSTNEEIYNKLTAPIKTQERVGKGRKMQKYVPHGNVTERINEVFGINWSFEILREYFGNGEVYAVVRIHYPTEDGTMRFKDGAGGIAYEANVGLGNQIKGSVSLALVKAASLLGIDIKDDESTAEQHEEISSLVETLGGKKPSEEKLKALNFQEANKMIEALREKLESK